MAGNPSVPQPGFEPVMISVRPSSPSPYSKGLRKPSGSWFLETKKSLSSANMPATVWTLASVGCFRMDEAERKPEGVGIRERHTETAQVVPTATMGLPLKKISQPNACAEMSG